MPRTCRVQFLLFPLPERMPSIKHVLRVSGRNLSPQNYATHQSMDPLWTLYEQEINFYVTQATELLDSILLATIISIIIEVISRS